MVKASMQDFDQLPPRLPERPAATTARGGWPGHTFTVDAV